MPSKSMEEIKCEGKTIYLSQRIANTVMNSIRRTSHRNNIPKRSYFCKKCKGWHLTSRMHKPKFEDDES